MEKMIKLMFSAVLSFSLVVAVFSCEQENDVLSKEQTTQVAFSSKQASAKVTKLQLKKVSMSTINKLSLATLKKNRPKLYGKLVLKDSLLFESPDYILYQGGLITVIIPADDVEDTPPQTELYISGYEKIPIDIIGDLVLWAVCQCEQGSDDCKFERDDQGNLGECTGGVCGDCRGGFELSGPAGGTLEVQASF